MIREVLQYPDPRLRQKSEPIEAKDFGGEELFVLIADLADTMRAHRALGLAAIQIGVPKRVFVMARSDESYSAICNPEIARQENPLVAYEGCLSFADGHVQEPMRAPHEIFVRFADATGQEYLRPVQGEEARVVFHETQHTRGELMVDRMSAVQRGLFLRRCEKYARRHARKDARGSRCPTSSRPIA